MTCVALIAPFDGAQEDRKNRLRLCERFVALM
jgi:hypothetical protein